MTAQQYTEEDGDLPPLYEPLAKQQRQIRLLFLRATNSEQEDEPITSLLVPLSLDEVKTRYAALSHVWGLPDSSQSIIVNGRLFPVSTNLLEFLKSHRRRCRNTSEVRMLPLWIDSICVNQMDIAERNSQAMLMKPIYQNAGMVVSWLGTSFPLSDWVFEVMKQFKEQIDMTRNPKTSKVIDASWLRLFPQACKEDSPASGPLRNVVWDSIRELCAHPYWKRIWIVQEIVLASTVMLCCGDDLIDLEDVIQVVRWLTRLDPSLNKPDNMEPAIWKMLSSRQYSEAVMGLQSVLHIWAIRERKNTQGWALTNSLRNHESTDPRDKLYGCLGITGLNIAPDYSKSVKDVYIEAASALMQESFESLLLLSIREGKKDSTREPLDIPSWAPNWAKSAPGTYSANHSFMASKGCPTNSEPVILNYSLHCTGVLCEEVVAVESVLTPEQCLKFCCNHIATRETDKYPTGIPHLRALFQVLLSDWDTMVNCRSEPESMMYQVIACGLLHLFLDYEVRYRSKNGTPQINNPLPTLGLDTSHSDLSTAFWNKIVGTSREPGNCIITGSREQQTAAMNAIGERLATTILTALRNSLTHRIGPESVQPGDQVFVMFGCNLPILLRPKDMNYTHIGPSYVVGFMEGEAMLAIKDGTKVAQKLEIR
ncbi:heterokaryon incompatibility protein-domain-containing protein [Truncatella angustata]|uniref:Heterokaryon incompatibility protein-domain-containing protein n=1 Tax=Truncatella angustata TaxID=152316 RepID=A0A9P9A3A7_9PEZI|nr:heterokaryon incompatibility protein-domain-containing protein [Truncatella angustata]KAH6659958.1 heterokaryon incompatibility protein-domain-containing protein [Truncatella angustata]